MNPGPVRASGRFARVTARTTGWPVLWTALFVLLVVPTVSFLVLALSPRLFGQGTQWFTLSAFARAAQGATLRGMVDSVVVSTVAALSATAAATGLAWAMQRTELLGRRGWSIGIWAVLLMPSYMIAVGWQVVLGRGGVLAAMGLHSSGLDSLFFGPAGYVLVLAIKGVPFGYFATAGPLAALGRTHEQAARVHGSGPAGAAVVAARALLPALLSSVVIVFAESMSDFGTAAVIAPASNFPVATYNLYAALANYPANFPVAAAIGWMLVASVVLALAVQRRLVGGKSFAVAGGRARFSPPRKLPTVPAFAVASAVAAFFAASLAVPAAGALLTSLLPPFARPSLSDLSFTAYSGVLGGSGLAGPVVLSLRMALVNATATLFVAALVARRLSARRATAAGALLDSALLAAIALPAIVLAAGYIFAYNLPLVAALGVHLYGTLTLLGMAYMAVALPSTSRVLMGPMSQVQDTTVAAARVHGSGLVRAWTRGALPLVAPSLLWAWLYTFATTFLELPASEMLSPPGTKTVAVAIVQVFNKSDLIDGTALSVVALAMDVAVIVAVLVAYRLAAPRGWARVGARVL